jgi:hypothetical protein
MSTGAVVARILTQYSDKGSKQAQKDIAKLGKRIDAFSKKAAKSFAIATAASAAFAVKIGTDAVKAAIEENRTQVVLANTLKNVAGATDATIKKVGEYIDKQEMLSTVSDTDLRASFGRLVSISGDVTEAMRIQTVALDTAAGTTVDFTTVSRAFEKASAGNFTALKKVLPGIDANILKNKDLGAALAYATDMYGGSAKAFGDTEPLKRLSIAYNRVLETLGTALLPVVIEFTDYITTTLLPALDEWIRVNEEELQNSLKGVTSLFTMLLDNSDNLTKTLETLVTISRFLNSSIFGIIKWGEALLGIYAIMKVFKGINKIFGGINLEVLKTGKRFDVAYTGAGKFSKVLKGIKSAGKTAAVGIGYIVTALRTQSAAAIVASIATAFATGGVNIAAATVALAAAGIAWRTYAVFTENAGKASEETGKATVDLTKQVYGGAAATKYQAEVEAAAAKKRAAAAAAAAKAAAAAAAQAKKDAAAKALIAKGQAALAKMGSITKEDDPIQLEAARLNLVKQGNLAEAARLATMSKNLALQLEANKALARYNDLLAVLADSKISSEEILLLSKKWGMTIEATQSYIQTLLAVADATISDDEIVNLAKAWGVSKEKAGMYLDFFNYLNDGKLSDAEIAKLQAKWSLTSKEVGIYADLITKASDYVLSDEEINALGKNWGLTTDEVIAYIRKLGQPVTFSGTLVDPATQAELGWKNALAALNAYLAALGSKSITAPAVIPPVVVVPKVDGSNNGTYTDKAVKDALDAKNAAASKAAADAYAAAKAAGNMDAAATAAAGVTPSALAAQESGAIGAASIAAQLRAAEAAQAIQDNITAMSKFRAKEAADLAASQAASAQMDYDEKLRVRAAQGVMSATASSSSQAPVVVNLTVQGSVTTEQDLVQTVRTGLLRGQYNGQGITLEAV